MMLYESVVTQTDHFADAFVCKNAVHTATVMTL